MNQAWVGADGHPTQKALLAALAKTGYGDLSQRADMGFRSYSLEGVLGASSVATTIGILETNFSESKRTD